MQHKRRLIARMTFWIAVGITFFFGLSCFTFFGVATHRAPAYWSWYSSAPGYGIVQIWCGRGQFHFTMDLDKANGWPNLTWVMPRRGWYAGCEWHPAISTDLRIDFNSWISKAGFDWFVLNQRRYGSVGVFGLYPAIIAWLLWWIIKPRRQTPAGHCPKCGYDLRATPDRCPECGTVPNAIAPVSVSSEH